VKPLDITTIELIPRMSAKRFIRQYHYSETISCMTRLHLGSYVDGKLVAVCTLGGSVQPIRTIAKCFPGLTAADCLEISRLCLVPEMPRNSESRFLSLIVAWLKRYMPRLLVLYSWADGIIGKPGYVYQAANFYYGGYIWSYTYVDNNGFRYHPRVLHRILSKKGIVKPKIGVRAVARSLGIKCYWGKQFRYAYPLCNNHRWRQICATSPFEWRRGEYPKEKDCEWFVESPDGMRRPSGPPPFGKVAHAFIDTNNKIETIQLSFDMMNIP